MKQVLKIMKSKVYQIPSFIFNNYKKLKISEKELVVLIYIYNNQRGKYNPKNISTDLNIKIDTVLEIINNLKFKSFIFLN